MQANTTNLLQQTLSKKHNNGLSNSRWTFSNKQRADMEMFKRFFPSENHIIAFFTPAKWEDALRNVDKCTLCPAATLQLVDEFYAAGTAKTIIRNNLIGIFSVARPNETFNENAIKLTANLFMGKYGVCLTPFGMLYYFANYLMKYKSSFSQFDLQDVLRQCDKAFMPWWQQQLGKTAQSVEEPQCKEVGKAALIRYLRKEYIAMGIDPHNSALFQYGAATEEDIRFALSGEEMTF